MIFHINLCQLLHVHTALLICLLLTNVGPSLSRNLREFPQQCLEIRYCLQGLWILLLNHSSANSIESPPPTEVDRLPSLVDSPISVCLWRASEIINWAQPAHSQDQYIMFVWTAGNFEFHWSHHKQKLSPTSARVRSLDEEKITLTPPPSAPDSFWCEWYISRLFVENVRKNNTSATAMRIRGSL